MLVIPSRSENLPLAALEGLAAGLPVVASDVGGLPEIVKPGRTGWLVRPEDPEQLADTLSRVGDSAILQKMSANARLAATAFDQSRMAKRVHAIYRYAHPSELPPWARTALAVLFAVAIGLGVALFRERALPLMAVEAAVILGFVVRPAVLLDATAALVPLGVFVAYLTPFMPGQAQAMDALLFSFAVSSFAHPSARGGRRRLPVAPMCLGWRS